MVFALVGAATVLRFALPGKRSGDRPRVAPSSEQLDFRGAREGTKGEVMSAFTDARSLLEAELDASDHPWTWTVGLRSLGQDVTARDRKALDALATFIRPEANSPDALVVPQREQARWVERYPRAVFAVLLQADPSKNVWLAEDRTPLDVQRLVRAVLSSSRAPSMRPEEELAWELDALTMGVIRTANESDPALAQKVWDRLGIQTEWSLKQLELHGRDLAVLATAGSDDPSRAVQAMKDGRTGPYAFDRAGTTLATATFRAIAALRDELMTQRGLRLMGNTISRVSLERPLYAKELLGTPERHLEALRYFTGIVEALGTADAMLNQTRGRASNPSVDRAIRQATTDAVAVFRRMEKDKHFESLAHLRSADPEAYFELLEALAASVRAFRIAKHAYD